MVSWELNTVYMNWRLGMDRDAFELNINGSSNDTEQPNLTCVYVKTWSGILYIPQLCCCTLTVELTVSPEIIYSVYVRELRGVVKRFIW